MELKVKSETKTNQLQFKYLDLVTVAFTVVLILSNFASSSKIIDWGISIGGIPLAFDAGTVFFPFAYIFGDILTEVYGYKRTRRVIWIGFGALIFTFLMFWLIRVLPGEATWQATVVRTVPAVGRGGWECWFRVGHGGIASAPEIAATAFPGDRYTLRPFFRTDELSVSPMTLLRDGPGPWSWMAALSIAVVLQLIVSLTGRAEAGVYRATGTRLSELWFMSLVRTVMIGAGATALGAMAAAVWLALQPANVISAAGLWYALQPVVLFATGLLVVLPALDTLSVAGSVADRLTA